MSRRKQTKPFKVEDKELEAKIEKKLRSRRSTKEIEPSENPNELYYSEDDDGVVRSRNYVKCDECGKMLASSLSLARHKLTHSQNKPYRCPHCSAGFKTSSNMHRHVRIHFRENEKEQVVSDPVIVKPRPPISNQRSPRQNIRAPNKFREFDVDLIGVGPRSSSDVANNRSLSKSKAMKEELDLDIRPRSESVLKVEDLVCHICNKTFISKFGLLTHSLTHNEQADNSSPARCDLCDQTFSTKRALRMHHVIEHKVSGGKANVKHSENFFNKMSEVDFSAKIYPHLVETACTNSSLGNPVQEGDHYFLCKKCDVAFPILEALKIHIKVKHKEKKIRKSETLLSSIGLVANEELSSMQNSEDDPKILNGKDDDVMYTSKLLSIKYIPQWLQDQPDVDPSTYDKVLGNEVNYYTSKLVLFDDNTISPPQEHSDCASDKNVKDSMHQSNSIDKKKVKNHVDSSSILRRFESSVPRKVDINKMSGEKNVFWCKICNYSSHEKSALVRHLLTHSGIRPYFCKICDYAFTTKANCERHVRKRHNCVSRQDLDASVRCDWELLKKAPREDIFMISASNSSCPVCQKSFSGNNELKQHMKIHEERHFVCQLCGVRCTTRNNCVRHILHKHPGIPHQEANTIITFCGSGPNDLDLDIDAMTTDGTEDFSDVDISRGRLKARNSAKQDSQWKSSNLQRRPETRHSSAKRPRMDELKTSETNPQHESHDEDENGIDNDTLSHAAVNKSTKIIPLIPLLKIKAYNEAAAKSYAQMVALYEHLNFFNPIQQDANLLDMDGALNQTVDEPLDVPGGEVYLGSETTFVCHTCAKAFDTKELLENHTPQCEYNASNEEEGKFQDPNEIYFENQENGEADEMEAHSENTMDEEWNQQNEDVLAEVTEDGSIANYSKTSTTALWQGSPDENSPYNAKSTEESVSTQEYDSAYGSDSKPRVGTYGKEPSYVEDSLLMSMFGEGDNSGPETSAKKDTANTRYASDRPTMVNMSGGSLAIAKYQGGLDTEDKAKNKGYHGRKCPQCNKTFPWASSLRRHIMTHTGLKLYMCRLCKMRFTTRSNLIRHVYRRHGMAKQHPDFASCLAKLNPSDSLLREVEADVRRRIDVKRKRIPGTRNAYERMTDDQEEEEESTDSNGKVIKFSNFQSMLEDDPDTMLVDLDYSPRDELNGPDENRQNDVNQQDDLESHEEEDDEENEGKWVARTIKKEPEANPHLKKEELRNEAEIAEETNGDEIADEPTDDVDFDPKTLNNHAKSAKNTRNKQSSHFVCGLCKKIFKTVDELISHLDIHNVPHCWHCPICRVPFTNKYNCQRHLSRRHSRGDLEPKYVEDSKHGPRNARGLPKSSRYSPDAKSKKTPLHAV